MLPWSRSSTSSSSSSTPPLNTTTITTSTDSNSNTSAIPPTFLANHHRSSTSSLSKSTFTNQQQLQQQNLSNKKGKLSEDTTNNSSGIVTDEDWSDGSDDEVKINKLVNNTLNTSTTFTRNDNNSNTSIKTTTTTTTINTNTTNSNNLNLPSSNSTNTSPITPTNSWSFNPFSLISPKSPTAIPSTPPLKINSNSTTTGNEIIDIASSSASSNAKGKKVASKQDDVKVEEVPIIERRGSHYRADQLREAIKPNVEDLVKDPLSLLTRLEFSSLPPPSSPSATSTKTHRPSISSPSPIPKSKSRFTSTSSSSSSANQNQTQDSDSDSDSDPSQGYLPLGALNISSTGPEIVEFGAEEEKEEDMGEKGREKRRRMRFVECLGGENVDLAELRKLSWAGIPGDLRPIAWQLLLGYLPAPSSRRLPTLARKRQEYADAVRVAFSRGVKSLDGPIWHQISIDVPRTNAGIRLWQAEATQRSLERILYVWAIRHPASGYVQGINDLVTPFFQVFLSSYITMEPEQYDVGALPPSVLEALEADSFWCLSKLLDGIQDNYIFAQPGIQRQVARMKELCSRVDAPLAHHLEENSVEFIQFAFRWMNCLLMRELSVRNIVRMWDTYLAEGADAFSEFHLYVCLAFLVKWSEQLRGMDFQAIIMFLQSLPTQNWSDSNTELLLSEAFMWSRTFEAR